jgi:hypothetical protein
VLAVQNHPQCIVLGLSENKVNVEDLALLLKVCALCCSLFPASAAHASCSVSVRAFAVVVVRSLLGC